MLSSRSPLAVIALAMVIASPSALAATTAAGTTSAPGTCAGVSVTSGAGGGQKQQYCQAASQAKQGNNASKVMWKVWAGVAGVCTSACLTEFFPAGFAACKYSNYGATGLDAGLTAQMASAMAGVGSSAKTLASATKGASAGAIRGAAVDEAARKAYVSASSAAKEAGKSQIEQIKDGVAAHASVKEANQAGDAAEKQVKDAKNDACLSAATAGGQTVLKQTTAGKSQQTLQASLQAAAQLDGNTAPVSDQGLAVGNDHTSQVCAHAASVGAANDLAAFMDCARSADPNIPAFVSTPEFAQQFEQKMGVPLGQFLDSQHSAEQALVAGMAAGLPPQSAAQMEAIVHKLVERMDVGSASSQYAGSGGGAGGGGGGGAELNPADLFAGLMNQLNPQAAGGAGAADSASARAAAEFERGRSLASLSENRSVSLFDRVSYRYTKHHPTFLGGAGGGGAGAGAGSVAAPQTR